MENSEYNNLIINNKLQDLASINNLNDLVDYKYLNLYLIEYLLKEGIHTKTMDSRTQHSSKWMKFYLKYDVLKPLLNCYLRPLLDIVDGKLVLDILLEKFTMEEKMQLLSNLKKNSYWELREHEKEIIYLYKKHGVSLSQIFIDLPSVLDSRATTKKSNEVLINEFCQVFKDTDVHILKVYIHEFKRRLSIDNRRASEDIKKLIEHKRKNKSFELKLSNDTEGEYNSELNFITISPKRAGVLTHELSHLLYNQVDASIDEEFLDKYNNICKRVNSDDNILRIVVYLKKFHNHFVDMQNYFEKVYYSEIKNKYGTLNNYIKTICEDIYKNNLDMISVDSESAYFYIDDENIEDVVSELLIIEKKEFINCCTRNYYSEELMLENLLDALLRGTIWEEKFDIKCLSGHSELYFDNNINISFDECLADYDAIINSKKKNRLLNDLRILVGEDLINLLDNYLIKNRGLKHGI